MSADLAAGAAAPPAPPTCSRSGARPGRTNGSAATLLSMPRSRHALVRSGAPPPRPARTLGGDAGGRARARHRARSVPAQHVPWASAYLRGGCGCPRRRRSRASSAASTGRCRSTSAASSICRSCTRKISPIRHRCLELARAYGDDEFMTYAEQHADIVRRFGRFPHRNPMLGRVTTPEEQAFLDAGGFAG